MSQVQTLRRRLKMFLGIGVTDGVRVDISGGHGASDTEADPTPAFAQVVFESDGDVLAVNIIGPADDGDWIAPKAAAPGTYEISMHQDSGDALDVTSDALDTWIALSTTPQWSISQAGVGSKTASLTASIRLGSTTLSSGAVSLNVQVI